MPKMGRPIDEDAKRKTICIRISDDTFNKLSQYASEHHLTKTEVAIRSLEEFFSKLQ